jgi:hypothetical protein
VRRRSALDETWAAKTLQVALGIDILRESCFCHTLLLGVGDLQKINPAVSQLLNGTAKNGAFGREAATGALLKEDGVTQKSPLCGFKWNSQFDTILFQEEHGEALQRVAAKQKRAIEPVFGDDWGPIRDAMKAVQPFLNAIQGDGVRLCQFQPHYERFKAELSARNTSVARELMECVQWRFENTADGERPKLAFVLTNEELAWFQQVTTYGVDDRRTSTGEPASYDKLAAAIVERDRLCEKSVEFQTRNGR